MLVTLFGITTFVTPLLANVPLLMLVTPLGIVTLVRLLQPMNA